jgi:phage shock protein E
MLGSLFGIGRKTTLARLLAGGPLIIDVRTAVEYRQGHAPGSVNIPLDALEGELKNLDKHQPIITCCRSGMRSASATSLLTNNGFMAHNGGSWQSVEKHLPRP